jgi:hypothetical protein
MEIGQADFDGLCAGDQKLKRISRSNAANS